MKNQEIDHFREWMGVTQFFSGILGDYKGTSDISRDEAIGAIRKFFSGGGKGKDGGADDADNVEIYADAEKELRRMLKENYVKEVRRGRFFNREIMLVPGERLVPTILDLVPEGMQPQPPKNRRLLRHEFSKLGDVKISDEKILKSTEELLGHAKQLSDDKKSPAAAELYIEAARREVGIDTARFIDDMLEAIKCHGSAELWNEVIIDVDEVLKKEEASKFLDIDPLRRVELLIYYASAYKEKGDKETALEYLKKVEESMNLASAKIANNVFEVTDRHSSEGQRFEVPTDVNTNEAQMKLNKLLELKLDVRAHADSLSKEISASYYEKAKALRKGGDVEGELAQLKKALRFSRHVGALLKFAYHTAHSDSRADTLRAIRYYKRLLEMEGSLDGHVLVNVYNNLGVLQHRVGDFEEALKLFLRAVRLDPSDPDYRMNAESERWFVSEVLKTRKLYLRRVKDWAAAAEACDKELLLENKNSDPVAYELLSAEAAYYWAKAGALEKVGARLSKDSPYFYFILSDMAPDEKEAERLFRRAIDETELRIRVERSVDPQKRFFEWADNVIPSEISKRNLAMFYERTRDYEGAEKLYREMCETTMLVGLKQQYEIDAERAALKGTLFGAAKEGRDVLTDPRVCTSPAASLDTSYKLIPAFQKEAERQKPEYLLDYLNDRSKNPIALYYKTRLLKDMLGSAESGGEGVKETKETKKKKNARGVEKDKITREWITEELERCGEQVKKIRQAGYPLQWYAAGMANKELGNTAEMQRCFQTGAKLDIFWMWGPLDYWAAIMMCRAVGDQTEISKYIAGLREMGVHDYGFPIEASSPQSPRPAYATPELPIGVYIELNPVLDFPKKSFEPHIRAPTFLD